MNADLLRFVDSISRDKAIDKESVYLDLEAAMISAAQRAFWEAEDIQISIDRVTGEITALADGEPIDMKTLGRIAAQTAKQVLIQKVREDERDSIFEEYSQRVGTVVTGTVARFEGGSLTVNLGRAEGFLPRSEQIPGDTHSPGERIRAMVLDVREEHNRVKIVLTQTHPDYIRKLFELEVPEVAERIIEVRALAREAGYRTKIAVSSIDMKVDPVGACVGVRGSRIRNIVDELGGEKIDIVRWNESSQVLIANALKPAEVKETFLCFELGRATVIVDEDQLSLAIGKRGQNVRLGARLTGWDIDISTPAEYDKNIDDMEKTFSAIEGFEDVTLEKFLAMGIVSVADIAEVGVDPLVKEVELKPEFAALLVEAAAEAAKRIAAEVQAAKVAASQAAKEAAEQAAAEADAAAKAESVAVPTEEVDDTSSPEADAASPEDAASTGDKTEADDTNPDESTSKKVDLDESRAPDTKAVQDEESKTPEVMDASTDERVGTIAESPELPEHGGTSVETEATESTE